MVNSHCKVKIVLKKEIIVNSATVHAAPACNMLKYTFLPELRNKAGALEKTLFPKSAAMCRNSGWSFLAGFWLY